MDHAYYLVNALVTNGESAVAFLQGKRDYF